MVLSNDFYNSAGVLRWNLGWASPTFAGAFLGTIIPYVWALEKIVRVKGKKGHYLSFLLEFILIFSLCKTQSRGALAALILASAYWHLFAVREQRYRHFAWKMILLSGCVWLAGFTTRIEPNYLSNDLSIRNRLMLWKGCLKVFAITPLGGCGPGSSGRLFRAWFEPLFRTGGYPTPVNSFLFAGIEYGPIFLGLIIFLLFLAVIAIPKGTGPDSPIWHRVSVAAGSSIVAWGVASLFSTLWDEYPLWIVPLLSLSVAIRNAFYQNSLRRHLILALALTLALGGSAKAVGWQLVRTEKIIPKVLGDGVTQLRIAHQSRDSWPPCHIWLDEDVLGPDPEKELRKWLVLEGSPSLVVVHDRWADSKQDPRDGDVVILVGRSAERLSPSLPRAYSRIILIHPSAPYRDSLALSSNAIVMLPEIDQDGALEKTRATEGRAPVKMITPGVGNDIRREWPAAMEKIDQLYR